MKPLKSFNEESEYFRIAFQEGTTHEQRYQLGQSIPSHNAKVWSINRTSYVENNVHVRRYTIAIINDKGNSVDYLHIENPVNIVLMPNFKDMIEI